MSFLEGLLKQALGGGGAGAPGQAGGLGDIAALVAKNPQILQAVTGLLSSRDATIGGTGGLAGLVGAFQKKGLGDMVSSWISTGPNPAISANQLGDVLGQDTMGQFAARAGLPAGQAGSVLAGLLPAVIDHLTPDGKQPANNTFDDALGKLLGGIGR